MIKKGTTTYHLLLALEKAIEIGTPLADFLDNPGKFVWTGYRTNLNYSKTYKAIQRLKEQGYLLTYKEENQIVMKLTEPGKSQASVLKALDNTAWDNKYRIVIFDVPEKHKKVRAALRYRLKEWQFEQLQKSVWVSKKNVIKELKLFIRELQIENWVKIFVADKES